MCRFPLYFRGQFLVLCNNKTVTKKAHVVVLTLLTNYKLILYCYNGTFKFSVNEPHISFFFRFSLGFENGKVNFADVSELSQSPLVCGPVYDEIID